MSEESRPPEFVVNEPEKLVDFYEKVLGWQALAYDPEINLWVISGRQITTDGKVDEINTPLIEREIKASTSFLCNFWVSDLEETSQRVQDNGGKIYITDSEEQDIIVIPELGRQRFFCGVVMPSA